MIKKVTIQAYSLVEVLIAISILMLAIAGPMTIAHKGLQSSYFARDQLTAFMLAQEGIEAIIALRNEAVLNELYTGTPPNLDKATLWTWADTAGTLDDCFTNDGDDGCNLDFNNENIISNIVSCNNIDDCLLEYDEGGGRSRYLTNSSGGEDTPFTRVIELEEVAANQEIKITSTVTWQPSVFGGAEKNIVLTTSILNLYAQP